MASLGVGAHPIDSETLPQMRLVDRLTPPTTSATGSVCCAILAPSLQFRRSRPCSAFSCRSCLPAVPAHQCRPEIKCASATRGRRHRGRHQDRLATRLGWLGCCSALRQTGCLSRRAPERFQRVSDSSGCGRASRSPGFAHGVLGFLCKRKASRPAKPIRALIWECCTISRLADYGEMLTLGVGKATGRACAD